MELFVTNLLYTTRISLSGRLLAQFPLQNEYSTRYRNSAVNINALRKTNKYTTEEIPDPKDFLPDDKKE